MNPYTRADWVKFREEVIKLDGGKCLRCLRSHRDGVVLQVHHKVYIAGRKPWEYEYGDCETLCRGCHASEHGKIPPKRGWECIGSYDLGDLIGNCELCGTDLRYLYLVQHPRWPAMEVGTDCCDNLTESTNASEFHDKYVKHSERIKRFISSPRWSEERFGQTRIKQKGIEVFITKSAEGFQIAMDGVTGKAEYQTMLDAKMKVFESIDSGEATKFLAARRAKLAQQAGRRRPR